MSHVTFFFFSGYKDNTWERERGEREGWGWGLRFFGHWTCGVTGTPLRSPRNRPILEPLELLSLSTSGKLQPAHLHEVCVRIDSFFSRETVRI